MSEQAGYYLWKWADNDLPGKPAEVFAALMRGELHPALQTFDARPLLRRLEKAAAEGRADGEEWDWQMHPAESPDKARFVFLTCPRIPWRYGPILQKFLRRFYALDLSGYDEARGQLMDCFLPKLNCFELGERPQEPLFDISLDELPVLLRQINPRETDPWAILSDRKHHFVQCYAHDRRFCVEWRENYEIKLDAPFDHWRAGYPPGSPQAKRQFVPLAAAEYWRIKESEQRQSHAATANHSALLFADTLRIFQAFLRGEPRPRQYHWRNINEEIP